MISYAVKSDLTLDLGSIKHTSRFAIDRSVQADEVVIVADVPITQEEIIDMAKRVCDDRCNPVMPHSAESVEIDKVKFSGPATIVFWADGSKTVVKCQEGDTFDPEKGLALCFMKKVLGNKSGTFNKVLKMYGKDDDNDNA